MYKLLAQPLDRFTLRLAARTVRDCSISTEQIRHAEALLQSADFAGPPAVPAPTDLQPDSPGRFRFSSALASPWARNNFVNGRLFRGGADWTTRPAVVLIHGWNAEAGYYTLYPLLARKLASLGVNAVTFELPYHGQRRPAPDSHHHPPNNFLSGDLLHVVRALQQALLDTRALISWLHAQGCPAIGTWGISLGGWLAGMLAWCEPRLRAAVLMTPVVRLDRVIAEAPFCAPLRRSLKGSAPDVSPLNLIAHQPRLPADKLLLVSSEHDLFAPIETLDELRQAWQQPPTWRTGHGHISLLFSAPVMLRTVRWLVRALRATQP